MANLDTHPGDRDSWKIEIDVIPGNDTVTAAIINMATGESIEYSQPIDSDATHYALLQVMVKILSQNFQPTP